MKTVTIYNINEETFTSDLYLPKNGVGFAFTLNYSTTYIWGLEDENDIQLNAVDVITILNGVITSIPINIDSISVRDSFLDYVCNLIDNVEI